MTTLKTFVEEKGNQIEGLVCAVKIIVQQIEKIPLEFNNNEKIIYLEALKDTLEQIAQEIKYSKSCRVTSNAFNGYIIHEEDIT